MFVLNFAQLISNSYMYYAAFIFHSALFWRFVHVNNADLVGLFLKTLYDIWYTPVVRNLDYYWFLVWCVKWIWQRFLEEKIIFQCNLCVCVQCVKWIRQRFFKEKINNLKEKIIIFISSVPTLFKISENFDAQKQILYSWRNEIICLLHSALLVKVLLLKQLFCVYNTFLISNLTYFWIFNIQVIVFFCL